MARVKLTEYEVKSHLAKFLSYSYHGIQLKSGPIPWNSQKKIIIKLDQGVKKRAQNNLLLTPSSKKDAESFLSDLKSRGYHTFLLEPLVPHAKSREHYLSLERVRSGWQLLVNARGGTEVESNWGEVSAITLSDPISPEELKEVPAKLRRVLPRLISFMNAYYLSFLEINPYIYRGNSFYPLDCAAEVDSAGLPFLAISGITLHPISDSQKTVEEALVESLDNQTPASLKLKILNPKGRIWMLLSGGGASLVLADEVRDLGFGAELANYGEYSGSPSEEDTQAYAGYLLQALLKSPASPKVLLIAGGVANFTDIRKTFRGIIRALNLYQDKLRAGGVKIFVRRGGPNQEKGLAEMKSFLSHSGLLGEVHGPELELTRIVHSALSYLKASVTDPS